MIRSQLVSRPLRAIVTWQAGHGPARQQSTRRPTCQRSTADSGQIGFKPVVVRRCRGIAILVCNNAFATELIPADGSGICPFGCNPRLAIPHQRKKSRLGSVAKPTENGSFALRQFHYFLRFGDREGNSNAVFQHVNVKIAFAASKA
jgi:hypothetical protein